MEKSFVTMEQKMCPICGKEFDSGALLLDKRMSKKFDMKTTTGYQPCSVCQNKIDEGYIALVVADPKKSTSTNGILKLENAYRTGEIIWMKRPVFNNMFNVSENRPMVFIEPEVAFKLRSMIPKKKKRTQKLRKDEVVTKKGIKRVKK